MPGFSGKTLSDFCPSAERGDHGIDFRGLHTFLFLLTPPGGGDRPWTQALLCRIMDFYSRPRAGAILTLERKRRGWRISTHAPGRGRSILDSAGTVLHSEFLLTPPGGGDPDKALLIDGRYYISTHAPGRGRSH